MGDQLAADAPAMPADGVYSRGLFGIGIPNKHCGETRTHCSAEVDGVRLTA